MPSRCEVQGVYKRGTERTEVVDCSLYEKTVISALYARNHLTTSFHMTNTSADINSTTPAYGPMYNLSELEYLLARSFQIYRRILGAEHHDTLKSMNNLAITYRVQGRTAEAAALHEEVLEKRRRNLFERA
jgi:hypothetical protein